MILSNPNASAALSLVLVSRDDRQAYDDNHGAEKVSENCAEEHARLTPRARTIFWRRHYE